MSRELRLSPDRLPAHLVVVNYAALPLFQAPDTDERTLALVGTVLELVDRRG
jgi:hypothetical protein